MYISYVTLDKSLPLAGNIDFFICKSAIIHGHNPSHWVKMMIKDIEKVLGSMQWEVFI